LLVWQAIGRPAAAQGLAASAGADMSDRRDVIVVVGGGSTACRAVEELPRSGFAGRGVMFAAEPHLPYERPAVSQNNLLGTQDHDAVLIQLGGVVC
jgi:hypothetical protein